MRSRATPTRSMAASSSAARSGRASWRGQVHADAQRRVGGSRPAHSRRSAHAPEHQHADVVDQVERLSERDELARREQAERRVRPAHQAPRSWSYAGSRSSTMGWYHTCSPPWVSALRSSASTCSAAHRGGVHLGVEEFDRPRSLATALCSALSASRSSDSASSRSLSLMATPTWQRVQLTLTVVVGCEGRQRIQLLADAQRVDRALPHR